MAKRKPASPVMCFMDDEPLDQEELRKCTEAVAASRAEVAAMEPGSAKALFEEYLAEIARNKKLKADRREDLIDLHRFIGTEANVARQYAMHRKQPTIAVCCNWPERKGWASFPARKSVANGKPSWGFLDADPVACYKDLKRIAVFGATGKLLWFYTEPPPYLRPWI